MKWFGPSWDAPVCEPETETHIPVGRQCERCFKIFEEGDQGIMLSYLSPNGYRAPEWRDYPVHLDCMVESIMGPEWER